MKVKSIAPGEKLHRLQRLNQRLLDLMAQEDAAQSATQRGQIQDEQAATASQRRQQQINRLGQALLNVQNAQEGANSATTEQTSAQEQSADSANRTARAMDHLGGSLGGAAGGIESMVQRWASFLAVAGTIIKALNDIADAANRSMESVASLGESTRGLAVNVGGDLADQVVDDVTNIARINNLGVEGRNQLLQTIAASTDVRPDQSRAEMRESAERFAVLQRGTGVGGMQAFEAVQQIQATLGVPEQEAVDKAAVLFSSGLDPATVGSVLERGGEVGGEEMLAWSMAARGEMNLRTGGRALSTLTGALTRRNQEGDLAEELTRAGVTEDMSLPQRLQQLSAALEGGQINIGQFEQAIGGAQNMRAVGPLLRAAPRIDEELEALRTPGAAEANVQRAMQSERYQAFERQQNRKLREKVAEEDSMMGGWAEDSAEFNTRTQEVGDGSWWLGAARRLGGGSNRLMHQHIQRNQQRDAQQQTQQTIEALQRNADELNQESAPPQLEPTSMMPGAGGSPVTNITIGTYYGQANPYLAISGRTA